MSRVELAAIVLSVAGIAVSIYLTALHYAGAQPACVTTGAVNCEAVLTSSYAVIAGTSIPTSAAGIVWFGVSAALWTRPAGWLHVGWSALGLLAVLYLVFVEIVLLGAICLWCTAAHLLVVALLLLSLSPSGSNQMAQRAKARRPYRARRGGSG
jgi:uncharacterized membrane protein